jgi:hypothetical protein
MYKIAAILLLSLLSFGCEKEYFSKNYNAPLYIFDSFWNEVDRRYSFFSYTKLNWDSVKLVYRKQINENTSDQVLFRVLGKMVMLLKDGHSNLFSSIGTAVYDDWYTKYPLNQFGPINNFLKHYFTNYLVYNSVFDYGKFKNYNLGYIYLKTFDSLIDRKQYETIDTLLNIFKSTDGLIIDVRTNGGGNSLYADLIASRFAQSKKFIFKYRTRNGPGHNDFSDWAEFYLTPNPGYNKPVVVLTNRRSFSATESFVLDMKPQDLVTIAGDTTGGGSANPLIRELPNGWIVRVSNSQRMTFEGRDFQFTGIFPDFPVWITKSDAQKNIDSILEAAINILQNKSKR